MEKHSRAPTRRHEGGGGQRPAGCVASGTFLSGMMAFPAPSYLLGHFSSSMLRECKLILILAPALINEGSSAGERILPGLPEHSIPLLVPDANGSALARLGKCG